MFSGGRIRGRALAAAAGLLVSLAALPSAQAGEVTLDLTPPPAQISGLAYVTSTATSPSEVWTAQLNGSAPRRLGPGDSPLISPNGHSVAAALFGATANSEQGPALAIYSTVGAPTTEYLSLETANATPLAWSPDSRYLAVSLMSTSVTNIAKGSGLAVIDTQTGTLTTIIHGQINGASFARDGSDRLIFGRAPSLAVSSPSNLYISLPNGSGMKLLTHDGRSLNPVWGSRYIAYDRERLRKNYAPLFQIWLRPASGGGGARRLTNVQVSPLVVGLLPLAFSADSSRLLAEYEGEDTSNAWTVRLPSGRAREIKVRGRSVVAGGLSQDGSTVLIDQNSFEGPPSQGSLASVPFNGGAPHLLVAHAAQGSWNG